MIRRRVINELIKWKERENRKPLILRGARQVGKTTVVHEFAKTYKTFLHLNLERVADQLLFEEDNMERLIRSIFNLCEKPVAKESVLLFIDEIQNSKRAVAMLRYFYEEANYIHVIAAGSLLETVMDVRKISFPVGRVSFMALRPCSFLEFLNGIGEDFNAELVENKSVDGVHDKIMRLFYDYTLVGGMPEAIVQYSKNKDILTVKPVYESLLNTYRDDVEKYSSSATTVKVIRSILTNGWSSAAECISFEKFGNTSYRSREMSEAFQTISKAMLLELVYPASETTMPFLPNLRKRPKLIWLDTGIVNYVTGLQKDVFSAKDIQDVWRGRIAEHIVAQELLTLTNDISATRAFWRRDKEGSDAEVDFLYKYNGKLIPIEVKSGHNSKLKSLHLYMNMAPHNYAVRIWSQPLSIDEVKTSEGKTFKLINLPFYYVGVLNEVLDRILED